MIYQSTKCYNHEMGLSCCFRQHRAQSHCHLLHGYAISVKFTFDCEWLDQNGWCMDFGALKPLKQMLEDNFDHTLLVAEDDPQKDLLCSLSGLDIAHVIVVERTGCEAFAKLIFDNASVWLKDNGHAPRVRLSSVEVREHAGNSAIYLGE